MLRMSCQAQRSIPASSHVPRKFFASAGNARAMRVSCMHRTRAPMSMRCRLTLAQTTPRGVRTRSRQPRIGPKKFFWISWRNPPPRRRVGPESDESDLRRFGRAMLASCDDERFGWRNRRYEASRTRRTGRLRPNRRRQGRAERFRPCATPLLSRRGCSPTDIRPSYGASRAIEPRRTAIHAPHAHLRRTEQRAARLLTRARASP